MSKVICGIAMSVDGFVAGANETEQNPFGDIQSELLHSWMFDEREKHEAEIAYLSSVAGAYIMGWNMFAPPELEERREWKGWWGDEPPFHAPVFVLTHRKREPITMNGGTTFYFVNDGIESALRQAAESAGDKPVLIAGGANTVNQYLAAGLIDELWLHVVPVTIGKGPRLFENVTDLRMEPVELGGTKLVTHIKYRIISPKA
ncbi:MAG TPA: dihydrofolate reductase family protein [Candidatus Saccharimonadales bacterium]|nr:dihydrofolate reductase family protein [Candidatus Saccharimonadales bacterium]